MQVSVPCSSARAEACIVATPETRIDSSVRPGYLGWVAGAGELVTIDGTVAACPRAPYVRARLVVSGAEDTAIVQNDGFIVVTDKGRQIAILYRPPVAVRPDRDVSDAWRTISQHPVQPRGEFHPDGHVTLRGIWIEPGDRVRVVGRATEHGFVDGTGSHREPPARLPIEIDALVIGVGDDAAAHAAAALAELGRANQPRRPLIRIRISARAAARTTAIVLAAAALALFAAEAIWARGTWGAGLNATFLALLFGWWAVPVAPFPGGAVEKDGEGDAHAGPQAMGMLVIVVVVAGLMSLYVSDPDARNAGGCGVVFCAIWVPLWMTWRGVLLKPRAVPGSQSYLPADKRLRWILLGGLVIVMLVAALVAIPAIAPHVSWNGDGGYVAG